MFTIDQAYYTTSALEKQTQKETVSTPCVAIWLGIMVNEPRFVSHFTTIDGERWIDLEKVGPSTVLGNVALNKDAE